MHPRSRRRKGMVSLSSSFKNSGAQFFFQNFFFVFFRRGLFAALAEQAIWRTLELALLFPGRIPASQPILQDPSGGAVRCRSLGARIFSCALQRDADGQFTR